MHNLTFPWTFLAIGSKAWRLEVKWSRMLACSIETFSGRPMLVALTLVTSFRDTLTCLQVILWIKLQTIGLGRPCSDTLWLICVATRKCTKLITWYSRFFPCVTDHTLLYHFLVAVYILPGKRNSPFGNSCLFRFTLRQHDVVESGEIHQYSMGLYTILV